MMLGKRNRAPMKRTTSLSEITFDLNAPCADQETQNQMAAMMAGFGGGQPQEHRFLASAASFPRSRRRASSDFLETPNFLRACNLCDRRLIPGQDIYMYRGDRAFCSLECRQNQMNQDERKDKCSIGASSAAAASTAKGETVAAV